VADEKITVCKNKKMKILVLPLIVTFLPIMVLFLVLKYWAGNKNIPLVYKIVLSVLFMAVSALSAYYAVLISIEGMAEKQIQCMTGAIVFIPLGLLNVTGIPLLLFSKNRTLY
jgi:hypothetical protein